MARDSEVVETIALRDRTVEITRTLGQINLDDLKGEIEEAGAQSIWWGVLAAHASADAERAKLRVDVTKAEIGKGRRHQNTLQGAKGTERSIEEDLILDPRYQAVMGEQIAAFERAGILNAVRFALDRKQKTLETLAGLLSAELGARHAGTPPSPEVAQRIELREHMARVARPRRSAAPAPVDPRRSAVT